MRIVVDRGRGIDFMDYLVRSYHTLFLWREVTFGDIKALKNYDIPMN